MTTIKRRIRKPIAPKMSPRTDYGQSADNYFARIDEDIRPVALELRSLILKAAPQATEVIKWGSPVYEMAGHRMWICSIRKAKGYVALQFGEVGTSLPDSDGLLEGTGKHLRH